MDAHGFPNWQSASPYATHTTPPALESFGAQWTPFVQTYSRSPALTDVSIWTDDGAADAFSPAADTPSIYYSSFSPSDGPHDVASPFTPLFTPTSSLGDASHSATGHVVGSEGLDALPDPPRPDERPGVTAAVLIQHAIEGSPYRRLRSKDICQAIMDRYPYYEQEAQAKALSNTVRHHLSNKPEFHRSDKPVGMSGKGDFWLYKPVNEGVGKQATAKARASHALPATSHQRRFANRATSSEVSARPPTAAFASLALTSKAPPTTSSVLSTHSAPSEPQTIHNSRKSGRNTVRSMEDVVASRQLVSPSQSVSEMEIVTPPVFNLPMTGSPSSNSSPRHRITPTFRPSGSDAQNKLYDLMIRDSTTFSSPPTPPVQVQQQPPSRRPSFDKNEAKFLNMWETFIVDTESSVVGRPSGASGHVNL